MVLDRRSAQKFASLSALGISALAIGGQKAEAAIVYSGAIDSKIGFDAGYNGVTSLTSNLTAGAALKFTRRTTNSPPGGHHKLSALGTNVAWAASSGHLQAFSAGATWNIKSSSAAHTPVASNTAGGAAFLHNLTSRYALFDFTGGPQTDYGWVLFSLQNSPGHGPDLDILGYAYDDSGVKIAAGDTTGQSGVPEPATFELTGLAMMSLGAAGVRRYRKARQTANIAA